MDDVREKEVMEQSILFQFSSCVQARLQEMRSAVFSKYT